MRHRLYYVIFTKDSPCRKEQYPHFPDEVTEFKATQLVSDRVGDFNQVYMNLKSFLSTALLLPQTALRVRDDMGAVLEKFVNLDSELLNVSGNPLKDSYAIGLCSQNMFFKSLVHLIWPQVDMLGVW